MSINRRSFIHPSKFTVERNFPICIDIFGTHVCSEIFGGHDSAALALINHDLDLRTAMSDSFQGYSLDSLEVLDLHEDFNLMSYM